VRHSLLELDPQPNGTSKPIARLRQFGIYLDNHSIFDLAKGPAQRRARFLTALERGADLLFSPVSAAEILGPDQQSSVNWTNSCPILRARWLRSETALFLTARWEDLALLNDAPRLTPLRLRILTMLDLPNVDRGTTCGGIAAISRSTRTSRRGVTVQP
jgi:hypothetical protein